MGIIFVFKMLDLEILFGQELHFCWFSPFFVNFPSPITPQSTGVWKPKIYQNDHKMSENNFCFQNVRFRNIIWSGVAFLLIFPLILNIPSPITPQRRGVWSQKIYQNDHKMSGNIFCFHYVLIQTTIWSADVFLWYILKIRQIKTIQSCI